jgi:hypothetical protein
MKAFVLPLCSVAGALIFGLNTATVSTLTNPPIRQSGLDAHDESASASLLGQFRMNVSAWLWVRTDLYLHNGVHMRPLTDAERNAGVQIEGPRKDGNAPLHKESSITIVPPPDRDYRGLLGDVDRAVNAWMPMKDHTHNDPVQTMPLFRLMTWLDPQFIEGWTTGSNVLARDRSEIGTNNAFQFLVQGLHANPESVDLLTEIAMLDISRRRKPEDAIPLLERARALGYAHRETLADNEKDALQNTYRWLALCYRDTHRSNELRRTAEEGLSVFPDDKVLPRILKKMVGAGDLEMDHPSEG